MRKPEYLSPSALSLYLKNKEDYFVRYISNYRPDREPQTAAMAVGSAFDAFCKSYLHQTLFGKNHPSSDIYDLETIFKSQVEEHNRGTAWIAGQYVFGAYKDSGALADLMFELDQASSEPRFEVEVRGNVQRDSMSIKKRGVTLLGKPDIFFINKAGAHVIFDWKVNGYYSNHPVSPKMGYRQIRDMYDLMIAPPSKTNGQSHKNYIPLQWNGMEINGATYFESVDKEWARQLSTYGWLVGESVGVEIVTAIDQIVCDATRPSKFPICRVAHHRSRVSSKFQYETFAHYEELWGLIMDEPFHFFRDRSLADSQGNCELLEKSAFDLFHNPDRTVAEKWLAEISRGGSW